MKSASVSVAVAAVLICELSIYPLLDSYSGVAHFTSRMEAVSGLQPSEPPFKKSEAWGFSLVDMVCSRRRVARSRAGSVSEGAVCK